MRTRHALALWLALLAGCTQSHGADGDGVCCPITDFTGCSPGATPLPGGGWAPSEDECASFISGYDGPPFVRVLDGHGCPVVQEDFGATSCGVAPTPIDAGPIFVDAGASSCEGLGPAACLAAGCAPTFDDACCPSCMPAGGCADCTHWTFHSCAPAADACAGEGCALAPFCATEPRCESAHPSAEDACDIAGCVPAYPSGTGEPDPSAATCVAITRTSCTVACRRFPPECPARTVPEGDGSCYTDRCIPAFVCE